MGMKIASYGARIEYIADEDDEVTDEIAVPMAHYVDVLHGLNVRPPTDDEVIQAAKEETDISRDVIWDDNGFPRHRLSAKPYLPKRFRKAMLFWFHGSRHGGHVGINKMMRRIGKVLWWPHMSDDVSKYVTACPICRVFAEIRLGRPIEGALTRPTPFEVVSLDLVGPRTYGGNKTWILVIIDHYSRFVVAIPVLAITAVIIIDEFKDHWVNRFGAPRAVLTDRGAQFVGREFAKFVTADLGAHLIHTSPYYPQGNSINESSHIMLEKIVKSSSTWTSNPTWRMIRDVVADAVLIHNATPHMFTGETPFALLFGQDLILPGWQNMSRSLAEEERLQEMSNRRMRDLMHFEVLKMSARNTEQKNVNVGDVVVFRLSEYERQSHEHITGEPKYRAKWSLPQRVTAVKQGVVMVKSLWRVGKERQVPVVQIKKVSGRIPQILRDQVEHNIVTKLRPQLEHKSPSLVESVEIVDVDVSGAEPMQKKRCIVPSPTNVRKDE
eukprot:Selendium_serpulae@DN6139_c3_g3_i2.p1